MRFLFILNGPTYGSEESYNALRLAGSLVEREGEEVRVFLLGEGVAVAKSGQSVPKGYYNLERMLSAITSRGAEIGACGTCMDARGIGEPELADGVHRSTLEDLTDWTRDADRVLIF